MADQSDVKVENVRFAWQQLQSELQHAETLENRVTLAVCSFILVMPYILSRIQIDQAQWVTVSLCLVVAAFGGLAIGFLLRNNTRARWLCRSIVRCEQVMKFYRKEAYVSTEDLSELDHRGFDDATLFEPDGQLWGMTRGHQLSVWPHVGAIALAAVTSCGMIVGLGVADAAV